MGYSFRLFPPAILALLVACSPAVYGDREATGGLTGAIVGGVLGSQFGGGDGKLIATGVGVLIGSLIGSDIGRSMEDGDRIRANRSIQMSHGTDVGETIRWNNPQSGNSGTVTVLRDGESSSGAYCREFQQTIRINGDTALGTGIACRQPDGTWRIVG
jgi:surface antigen